jgi:nicotinamidase-related amidase
MNLERAALVVVDMQNGFINERSCHVVPTIVDLAERWERAGGAMIFTRYFNYPNSPFERLVKWSLLQTSPETDIVADLAPQAERAVTIIDKKIYSLFNAEGATMIEQHGWTDLVFCGIATESCVLKSAVDAFELGYRPWIVTDASASHAGETAHQAGLLVAERFIGAGQLVTAATVLPCLNSANPS